jgi:hypothetical protein
MHSTRYRPKTIFIKNVLCVFILLCVFSNLQSQTTTAGILFQAIARDNALNPANNRKIYVRTSILSNNLNDAPILLEEHEAVTDNLGVFNIAIGKGKFIAGTSSSIDNINWSVTSYQLNLKISITPIAPSATWDYHNEWIELGNSPFGVVPYAMHVLGGSTTIDPVILNSKLNITDTAKMLSTYAKALTVQSLANTVNAKLNITDTATMLSPYMKSSSLLNNSIFNEKLNEKVNMADSLIVFITPTQLASSKYDTSLQLSGYARTGIVNAAINLKEDLVNKATDISNASAYNNIQYPSVKAIKDYVDAALVAGAPDADINTKGILKLSGDLSGTAASPIITANSISTIKVQDAAITDAKIAAGINASKVGLGNVTNNPQLYNLNGLTAQVQSFTTPGTIGLYPSWTSSGSSHTLNIPLASASSVTAGLVSKVDYDHFVSAYSNNINTLTTLGTSGVASLSGQNINIPSYSLVGLAGAVNANTIFAGPSAGGIAAANFRALVSLDIPNNAANTSGNAATASKLLATKNINGIAFDGSADIDINANTANALTFSNDGLGIASGGVFNGSVAKTISYNTVGAAPAIGANSITTLGSISTGTWAASVIDANYGGAGNVNGLLKANGAGLVSAAVIGSDYIAPFGSQTSKYFYAAPNSANGNPVFRSILASDIPVLNQNTTGNAATASTLETPRLINGVSFNGASDITIATNTSNAITFNNSGTGAVSSATFNGSAAKTISYNTIGAAPAEGSSSITVLGTITSGKWSGTTIDASHGGAGMVNGVMKADGFGNVTAASAVTDYQLPLSFTSPITNISNTISLPVATASVNGYLSKTDWSSFNNKINLSEKGAHDGVASLDGTGKIPTSQIPAISFSSGYVVTSETAMLALSTAVVGSIAIRTDNSKNYVLSGLPATILGNWLELLMPAAVSSVNGYTTGSIVLTSSDINEGTNLYYTPERAKSVISASSPIAYSNSTGIISIPAATTSGSGYITATDWNTFNNKLGSYSAQTANTIFAGPATGVNSIPSFRAIVVNDIPTLNQNTTGNAATATKLAATKNINGIAFDGSSDITIASTNANSIIFNNSGLGNSSPSSFDGSIAKTISYNTIGAAPSIGSTNITTLGTVTTGNWAANVIDASHGGAGVVNGILKADGTGNVTAASAGTDYQQPFGSQTSKYFYAAPNATNGNPIFRSILASDIPILNQATTANAGTSTKLAASKNINGVPFDGSSDITISANVASPITFDNSGTGGITTTTFNGSVAKTISYNTIGAAPAIGSNAIITLGSITTGTWLGTVIDANHGGAGNISGVLKANGSGVVSAATAGTDFENALTFNAPLSRTLNAVSIPSATTSSNGYLTATDWNAFNGKQSTILAGTGVSITGGNTVAIGQSVATNISPTFNGMTLSGLNVSGIVTNNAAGLLSSTATTGTGNIVRSISPTLVTPILGDATATSINVSGDITAKRFKLTMPSAITAAATTSIDLSTGNVFTVNMGMNITTLTLTNPVVGTYLIKFVQDATGTRDVSFPVAWKWAGGVIPSLTNTANKLDIVTLIYDGTTYYTTIVQNF